MTNENLDRPEGEYPLSSLINPITAERLDGKPLSEHSVEEIYDFFRYCDAITYVFLARGEGDLNEIGPNVLSALELVSCIGQGMEFQRPVCKRDQVVVHPKDFLEQIQHQVEIRAQELRRRPRLSFALGWAVGDETAPHISHSNDKSQDEALSDLVQLVKDDIDCYAGVVA